SQCVLKAAGSSASGSGESITVNVEFSFKDSFAGTKRLYLNAQTASVMSNWKAMGTWTVTPSRR
ncbi:MAG: hypothetical protein Q8Q12_00905, partial [bacterium]|nr:hypothetical protein [bacterium]